MTASRSSNTSMVIVRGSPQLAKWRLRQTSIRAISVDVQGEWGQWRPEYRPQVRTGGHRHTQPTACPPVDEGIERHGFISLCTAKHICGHKHTNTCAGQLRPYSDQLVSSTADVPAGHRIRRD